MTDKKEVKMSKLQDLTNSVKDLSKMKTYKNGKSIDVLTIHDMDFATDIFKAIFNYDDNNSALLEKDSRIEELERALEKFCAKSNGLSIYVRDRYERDELMGKDLSQLVYKIDSLYDFQCDVESEVLKKGK